MLSQLGASFAPLKWTAVTTAVSELPPKILASVSTASHLPLGRSSVATGWVSPGGHRGPCGSLLLCLATNYRQGLVVDLQKKGAHLPSE